MSHPNPVISSILIAPTATANTLLVGDIINGMGIPVDSMVLNINSIGGGQWEILINQTPNSTDVYTIGNHGAYSNPNGANDGRVQWQTDLFITRDGKPFPFVNAPTLSFNEKVRGWVSFKSFAPENAISLTNEYYTFLNGKLFKHHVETVDRNTFYSEDSSIEDPFTPSSFNVLLNDVPGSIKSFSTLNYEGSQTKVDIDLDDDQYFNLTAKKGWYVESVETDQEKGDLNEFIEKEGKWFNYLKGQSVLTDVNDSVIINEDGSSSFDQSSFAIQGIGTYDLLGCTDIEALNYNPNANGDDGSCEYQEGPCVGLVGCTNTAATNYDPLAVCNGGCLYIVSYPTGCTNPLATNYDPLAIIDDGSCLIQVRGGGSAIISGCTNPAANNYNPEANVNDGSCIYSYPTGCTNPLSSNYDPLAVIDDGSCLIGLCDDSLATNYGSVLPCLYLKDNPVSCDACQDGAPVSVWFSNYCPEGLIPTGTGNPCGSVLSTPSWNCFGNEQGKSGSCVDPGTGNGMYSTLADCQAACSGATPPSFNCVDGTCIDPGTGFGAYSTLIDCERVCAAPPTPTWNCVNGACVDPGTGLGVFSTYNSCLEKCQSSPSMEWECIEGTCTDVGVGNGSYTSYSNCIELGCETVSDPCPTGTLSLSVSNATGYGECRDGSVTLNVTGINPIASWYFLITLSTDVNDVYYTGAVSTSSSGSAIVSNLTPENYTAYVVFENGCSSLQENFSINCG